MASVYKRLGAVQGNGVIGTAQDIYAASGTASAATIISSITICNTASSAATYRLGISTASTTFQAAGYIVNEESIAANDTVALTLGVVMDPTNRYLVGSTSASTVSISAFGSEVTP